MEQEFITKDSGQRKVFSSGMQRDTSKGKPRFDLILPLSQPYNETMLYRWAMLLQRGAEKYNDRNWELAATKEELDRYRQSVFRHFIQWFSGDTSEDHAAAIFFNVNGAEYIKGKLNDDKEGKQ